MKSKNPKIKSVGIIGYGRFGRLTHTVIQKELPEIDVFVSSKSNPIDNKVFFEFKEVAKADIIIPCVPIRNFEKVIMDIAPSLEVGQTIIEVCSVNIHPKNVLLKHVNEGINIIGSHPMFGPNTYSKLGMNLNGFNFVIENIRSSKKVYSSIITLLVKLGLEVSEIDANEHDRLAARFHFLTLINATSLKQLNMKRSKIDTKSATTMMDYLDMISVDEELVKDLYKYNPYCKIELKNYEQAFKKTKDQLVNNI